MKSNYVLWLLEVLILICVVIGAFVYFDRKDNKDVSMEDNGNIRTVYFDSLNLNFPQVELTVDNNTRYVFKQRPVKSSFVNTVTTTPPTPEGVNEQK